MNAKTEFNCNGRSYRCPARPLVAICLDGSSDEYLNEAMLRGLMPNLQEICRTGRRAVARAAMPTFTNVNNASIVTGVPPKTHGICGNYFFDAQSGQEVMMNSSSFLRAPTIFPAAARAGRKVAVVTAKEKLRDIFASGLTAEGGIAFSAEKADASAVFDLVKLPTPKIYSAEASLYVLEAGAALLKAGRADFLYLSTTDYVQHKAAPGEEFALQFYKGIDATLGKILEAGAIIGITADHGMNPKQNADGSPHVIYLESVLNQEFSKEFRVILPITDPYVAHHGALGSFAVVHCPTDVPLEDVRRFLMRVEGVSEVCSRAEAVQKMELPEDRLGEFVVCAKRDVTLGRTPKWHDLSALDAPLRSHGGRYEEMVPFIFSQPLSREYDAKLNCDPRNFDLFDFLINGGAHE